MAQIGPYTILEKLGAGGMGEVYRARDSRLGRDVAIKTLPPQLANDADYLVRFQREAQVLASLNHPNIAAIYGLEENAIIMELVEGGELKGPLPADEVIRIAKQIADALEAAHERGIIHRDLKPGNIKITPDGTVKVLDFGLAKATEPAATSTQANSPTLTLRATEAGLILGTAAYMAPEQAAGKPVDRRADVWAFGVVLWELITGRQLFHGETVSHTLAAVLKDPVDLTPIPEGPVRALIGRCLERDARKRLAWIGESRAILDAPPAAPPARSKYSFVPWAIAGALAAALVATMLWKPPARPADQPLFHLDLDTSGEADSPALSPDGQSLAYVVDGQIAVRSLREQSVSVLAGTEDAVRPFFSPDGAKLAFYSNRQLRMVSLDGRVNKKLCEADFPASRGGTWAQDGTIYATRQFGRELLRVSADGSRCEQVQLADQQSVNMPQALPGGAGILFSTSDTQLESIYVLPMGGGKAKQLLADANAPRYLPAHRKLFYHRRGIVYADSLDLKRMELAGSPVVVFDGLKQSLPEAPWVSYDVAGSAGTFVYKQGDLVDGVISWLDPDGSLTPVMTQAQQYRTPRLSPDGKRFAFTTATDRLMIHDLTTRSSRSATSQQGRQDYPVWSPDGENLAFRWFGFGLVHFELATGARTELGNGIPWSFSPDGRYLLDSVTPSTGTLRRIRVTAIEKTSAGSRLGKPKEIIGLPGSQSMPAVSPDGKWLAFRYSAPTGSEIMVIPFRPGDVHTAEPVRVSTNGGQFPLWSRNGELFYESRRQIMVVPWSVREGVFAPGKPRLFSSRRLLNTGAASGYDIASDGKRALAIVHPTESKPDTHLYVLVNVAAEIERRGQRP